MAKWNNSTLPEGKLAKSVSSYVSSNQEKKAKYGWQNFTHKIKNKVSKFKHDGKTKMHSNRMRTAHSLPYRESLSWGGGGLCPGGSLSRGGSCPGGLFLGDLCPGGLYPGGLSPGGSLSRGSLSKWVTVQGSVWGVSV